jgi:hypothetical protein
MKRKDRIEQAIIHLVSVAQNLNETTQDILCRLEALQDRVDAIESKIALAGELAKGRDGKCKPSAPTQNLDLSREYRKLKLDDLVVWR